MIEIIVIWRLAVFIGRAANQKGLKKTRYQIMAVLLWLCGELLGVLLGYVIFAGKSSFWPFYIMALIGGITGAVLAFLIMRLLPNQITLSSSSGAVNTQEISSTQKFGRSLWIPGMVIFVAVSCLCIVFGGTVFLVRNIAQQIQEIRASNPVIGIEISNDGSIKQSVSEISSMTDAIYFGFYYENQLASEMPVTFDWYIDGNLAISFSKKLNTGQVVVALDRNELYGTSPFNNGNYEVKARIGEKVLTSSSFVVK
jgi:hypothetical protein